MCSTTPVQDRTECTNWCTSTPIRNNVIFFFLFFLFLFSHLSFSVNSCCVVRSIFQSFLPESHCSLSSPSCGETISINQYTPIHLCQCVCVCVPVCVCVCMYSRVYACLILTFPVNAFVLFI